MPTKPGARSRYLAAIACRADPSEAGQKAALDKVAELVRRRDIAEERLINGAREALTIDVSLRSLAQALRMDEDQVLRLADWDTSPKMIKDRAKHLGTRDINRDAKWRQLAMNESPGGVIGASHAA